MDVNEIVGTSASEPFSYRQLLYEQPYRYSEASGLSYALWSARLQE
jgi:hypothetical protein